MIKVTEIVCQKVGDKGRSKLPIPLRPAFFPTSISETLTTAGPITPTDLLSLALSAPQIKQRLTHSPGQSRVSLCPVEPAAHSILLGAISKTLPSPGKIWVLGSPPRHRERLVDELYSWGCPAVHLPTPGLTDSVELIDPESEADRLALFQQLRHEEQAGLIILADADARSQSAPDPQEMAGQSMQLAVGEEHDPEALLEAFAKAGFERVEQVYGRQQFARRGGIVDLFPLDSTRPIRLEFFDREIESIRLFDLNSQTSVGRESSVTVALTLPAAKGKVSDWIGPADLVIALDEDVLDCELLLTDAPGVRGEPFEAYGTPFGHFDAGDFILQQSQQSSVLEHVADWIAEGWTVCVAAATEGERERFLELCGTHLPSAATLRMLPITLPEGFVWKGAKLAVISLAELFGRHHALPRSPGLQRLDKQRTQSAATELNELSEEDLVVHADYGVGRFQGVVSGEDGDDELSIEYRDGATLQVPVDQAHLISRYVGVGGKAPMLSQLGGNRWSKLRQSAESAILDYAAKMLQTQAAREKIPGHAHPPDSRWMWEFESAFPYTETTDQLHAISDVKSDMESPQPMDRLICGDVGFGKTEVALRAAFKAVTGGKQVAILVPTTVLAEQHWRNFRERMSDYPVRIDLLNRFRSGAEVRDTLKAVQAGAVDILIGTHRILSADVSFENLGLVVIDEEQRFGVKHKEIFKERFRQIDLLTLSATPIPRTLYFSLMGARDMSTIDTAPPNRIPVNTSIAPYDERLIRDAIRRELERGGQIFFLHNRVQTIEGVKTRLQELVPEAKIIIGHGQMAKDELEVVMHTFVDGNADILLSTTIIESGIDIPNANTILIDRADRFGLADLYQLRGRVGRAGRRAYAILLLPPDLLASGDARKRINAIRQYTALGSGFKIAMRDLEIRGAGSLLGTKQSGQIAAIGFDLYCSLLRQSIERLSGTTMRRRTDVVLRADFICFSEARFDTGNKEQWPAFIPSSFITDSKQRIAAYRELASLLSREELLQFEKNLRDRYGRLPTTVSNLLQISQLRLEASRAGAELVEIKGQRLMVQRNGGYITLAQNKFPRLSSAKPGPRVTEAVEWLESLS